MTAEYQTGIKEKSGEKWHAGVVTKGLTVVGVVGASLALLVHDPGLKGTIAVVTLADGFIGAGSLLVDKVVDSAKNW